MPAKLLDLLRPQAWAILPEHLEGLLPALRKAGASLVGQPQEGKGKAYELDGGVAIIRIRGALSKSSWWGTSFGMLCQAVSDALADPSVRAILLVFDSPGGTVAGTQETAHFLAQAAAQKPLFAYADGLMTSAAYWLASTAKSIAAPETAEIGSIGVLMVHTDWSKWNEEMGLSYTYLHAGEFKAAGHPDAPLSDGDRAYFQEQLTGLYDIFLRGAARGRGLDAEALRQTQAKIFLAEAAKEQGLIDHVVADLEEFITQIKEGLHMTLEELRAQHPDLVKAVEAAAREGMVTTAAAQAQADQAAEEAAQTGQDNAIGLVGSLMGPEAAEKIKAAVAAGVTPDQIAKVMGLVAPPQAENEDDQPGQGSAESGQAAKFLTALQAAAPEPLSAGHGKDPDAHKDFGTLAREYKEAKGCSLAEAQKAVAAKWPDKHQAYIDQANQDKETRR